MSAPAESTLIVYIGRASYHGSHDFPEEETNTIALVIRTLRGAKVLLRTSVMIMKVVSIKTNSPSALLILIVCIGNSEEPNYSTKLAS